MGDLKGALLDTEFAMRDGDNNVKALFRQGQVNTSPLKSFVFFEGSREFQILGRSIKSFVLVKKKRTLGLNTNS